MKTLEKYWKYFLTICKHKLVVYQECCSCGIAWQGITHDLSKFSKDEFISSAKHYCGTKSPHCEDAEENGYSLAWLHHKGCNKHHWEFWIDFNDDGSIIANKIPYNYVVEMVCDWIGAGKVYNKDKWTNTSPLEYYNKVRKGRHFHPDTARLILIFLNEIASNGLNGFHKLAKNSVLKEIYSDIKFPEYKTILG